MTTIEEATRIARELAEEKRADEISLREKYETISGLPVPELTELRRYWVEQAKSHRGLDVESMAKNREAAIWVKAIDSRLAQPARGERNRLSQEPQIPSRTSSVPVSVFKEDYLAYMKTNMAAKTHENAERVMKFFTEMFGAKDIAELTLQDLEKYKAKRKSDRASDTTINIDVRTIKAAFQIAVDWGKIVVNPFERAKGIRVAQKVKSHFDDAELTKLLGAIKEDWFKNIVRFAILTGLRRGEILNLSWSDFDRQKGTITIQSSGLYRVKGGKTRVIPLQQEALDILISLPTTNQKVFTNGKGESPSEDSVTKKFKRCVDAAGLPADLHFHSLRHTFGTRAASQGVSTNILKVVMGHANIKTTEGYMGADEDIIRNQMGKVTLQGLPAEKKKEVEGAAGEGVADRGEK